MFKLQNSINIDGVNSKISVAVIRLVDEAIIPFDPDNTDYQTYLAWCAEGNIPLPAEE